MEHQELLLVFLFLSSVLIITASKHPTLGYDRLFIDCGSSSATKTDYNLTTWLTDEEFIKTGKKFLLIPDQKNFNIMNTLRFFPDGSENCYVLPLSCAGCKFLFRAGFFYGNYDGLSKPPSFKLEIDGNLWGNVTTSLSQEEEEPVYYEVIYMTKREETRVCLVRNNKDDDQVPFISSLEVKSLLDDMYTLMENNTALYLHSRIDYGANKTLERRIDLFAECCNRIWKSKEMSEYLNVTGDYFSHIRYINEENYPPWVVMASAIQAKNVSDSIYLPVNFSVEGTVKAYFVLYFMDPIYPDKGTSKIEVYIDGKKFDSVDVPEWAEYKDVRNVISLYPVLVSGSANVTLAPANGSTMGPLLNAMEVYYAIDAISQGGNAIGLSSLALWFMICLLHLLHHIFVYQ